MTVSSGMGQDHARENVDRLIDDIICVNYETKFTADAIR